MHILAVSDIHGAYARVDQILEREQDADLLVVAGDLTTFGSQAEARSALEGFGKHGIPLVAVAGNMDPPPLEETFSQLGVGIDGRGVSVGEVGLFGVSAAPHSFLHTPYERAEGTLLERAEAGWQDVASCRWKIFVPHAPPANTALDRIHSGRHVGSTAIREFVERRAPDVLICGHIHEARGRDHLGTTILVNCGSASHGYYAIVTVGETIDVELRQL